MVIHADIVIKHMELDHIYIPLTNDNQAFPKNEEMYILKRKFY